MSTSKILFVLPSLRPGGAERVFSFVAQHIDKKKYEAELLVIGYKKDAVYQVNDIKVTYLDQDRVMYAIPNILKILFRGNYTVVVSSIGQLNTVLAMLSPLFFRTKFIIREASVISIMKGFRSTKRSWYNTLARISYPWTDRIICQSKDMAADFAKLYKIDPKKLVIIGNPITNENANIKTTIPGKVKKFITVGRLSSEKGHTRILEVLSEYKEDFRYTLVGDGPYKAVIFEKAQALGLDSKIDHIPYSSKVDELLIEHDYFLQGSFVEGFPNATLESCSVGVPVIAFNAPGGTKEILENGVNGYLVDSKAEFLDVLHSQRTWDANHVKQSVYQKFSKEIILKKYEALIDELLK